MDRTQADPIDGGDISNLHQPPPDHHVPLDHLRSLYYRPALGSGILVPSSDLSRPATSSRHAIGGGDHTPVPATSSDWSHHRRVESGPTRNARSAASSFWSHNVPHAHPESHVSILAQAHDASSLSSRTSTPPLQQRQRQLSYIHAAPGSSTSSYSIGVGSLDAARAPFAHPSSYGYLPTRVLPVEEKKRILITGGAGFVGSHLVDRLMLLGHEVLVIDNFFTGQKSNVSQWVGHPNFELIRHDVVEPLIIEVDQIYHLACPASPISYQANQIKTIKTNFMGTLNSLGLAKRTKARFLLASTSEVYGDPDVHPQPETYNGNVNPVGPRACYDEGKRVAETLTYGYYYQDGVDVRVARIFNTYGPRMHPHDGRVVSNLIQQALRGEPLTVFGDGSQTRSFMFIHDLIDGLISLMNAEPEPATQQHQQHLQQQQAQAPSAAALKAADIMTEANDTIIPSTSAVSTPAPSVAAAAVADSAVSADQGYFNSESHRLDVHTPVNLGNPAEFTIMELVHLVQKCVAKVKSQDLDTAVADEAQPSSEIRFLAMPKDDPRQRRPDITRATSLLDWYPRWKLQDGLEEMTRWYWERIKEGSL